jgi:[acyl-carrier-protein] S-malonyltransferase
MGRDLWERFTEARGVFEAADQAVGFDLSRLIFEGPEDELTQTVNAQPALLAVSVAVLRVVSSKGLVHCFAAGHSVGEYAALVSAGALDLLEAVRLVRRRGELMQQAGAASPGAMAAVLGLDADLVRGAVADAQDAGIVDVANYNSPGQVVISGEPGAVERASEIARDRGARRVVPLKVSGAFHSRLMRQAADAMREELETASISDPIIPVVANVTADYVRTAGEVREALARQIVGSVRWEESVRRMAGDGAEGFIELGPGSVLAGLITRTLPEAYVASVGDSSSLESLLAER